MAWDLIKHRDNLILSNDYTSIAYVTATVYFITICFSVFLHLT